MRRKKLNRKRSNQSFRRGTKVHRKNGSNSKIMRGGYRI